MSIENVMGSMRERIDAMLPHGSLRRRLARGAFWSMVGGVLSQGLALAASIVVGRVLGREGFGELGMIRSTIGMFGLFGGMGMGLTANKHVAEFREKDPKKAGRIVGMAVLVAVFSSVTMAIVLFFAAPFLARDLLAAHKLQHPEMLVELLEITCVMLFFDGMNGAQAGTLAGFESFKVIARVNLFQGLLNFPLMLVGVLAWGLPGAVSAMALTSAGGWVMNHYAVRIVMRKHGISPAYRGLGAEMPILWRFTLPALLGGLMVGPVLWAANAIFVNARSGYGGFGLYTAANQWQIPIMFLANQVCAVLLPMLSSFNTDKDGADKSGRVMEGALAGLVLVVFPLVALISLLAGPIMALYGKQFDEAVPVLSAVLFTAGMRSIGSPAGTTLASRGAMWSGLLINAVWGALTLLFVWLWSDRGATGLANAIAMAYLAIMVGGGVFIGIRGYASWRLIFLGNAATAALAVICYGPTVFDFWWSRAALVPFAVVMALWFVFTLNPTSRLFLQGRIPWLTRRGTPS